MRCWPCHEIVVLMIHCQPSLNLNSYRHRPLVTSEIIQTSYINIKSYLFIYYLKIKAECRQNSKNFQSISKAYQIAKQNAIYWFNMSNVPNYDLINISSIYIMQETASILKAIRKQNSNQFWNI